MKTLFFTMLLAVCASCQTSLPSYLTYDYDYNANSIDYRDSTTIMFDVYQGLSLADTSYALLDSTQTHLLRLLDYSDLYDNQTYFFYCRARSIIDGAISLPSDTIYAYFPKIIAGKPYNIEIIKIKLK